jgi:hypothetical protein
MIAPANRPFPRPLIHFAPVAAGLLCSALVVLAGCSKKDEAATTATGQNAASTPQTNFLSRAPQGTFLLVSYDGESAGGKRLYSQSLDTVRKYISAADKPTSSEKKEDDSKSVASATTTQSARSIDVVQRDLVEILESAGFLPREPSGTPSYQQVVIFASAGNSEQPINGGVCATGPEFANKLKTLIDGVRGRNYEVAEHTFGQIKGYAISTEIAAEVPESAEEKEDNSGGIASQQSSTASVNTSAAQTTKVTVFIGASSENVLGVSSSSEAVSHCLNPNVTTLPPVISSQTVTQVNRRLPQSENDFLHVYFDLGQFKQALESKRDALEKLLGQTTSKKDSSCEGSDEACSASQDGTGTPATTTDEIAEKLPSLQDAITQISDIPAQAIVFRGSVDESGALTFRATSLIDKSRPDAAALYDSLNESKIPGALRVLPANVALLLSAYVPVGKALEMFPMPKDSPYAALTSIQSVALALFEQTEGAYLPDLGIVIESTSAAALSEAIKVGLTPMIRDSGMPMGTWETKSIDGVNTTYVLSPFGIGLFLAESKDALLIGSSEAGVTKMITAQKTNTASASVAPFQLTTESKAPLVARANAVQIGKILRGLYATLAAFGQGKSPLEMEHINAIEDLGDMYLTLQFDQGFVEVVWRKLPKPSK